MFVIKIRVHVPAWLHWYYGFFLRRPFRNFLAMVLTCRNSYDGAEISISASICFPLQKTTWPYESNEFALYEASLPILNAATELFKLWGIFVLRYASSTYDIQALVHNLLGASSDKALIQSKYILIVSSMHCRTILQAGLAHFFKITSWNKTLLCRCQSHVPDLSRTIRNRVFWTKWELSLTCFHSAADKNFLRSHWYEHYF